MKFIKIKNHIFNIDNIFDVVYYDKFGEHFEKIGLQYFVIPLKGCAVELLEEEYNELVQIIDKINHSEKK